MNAALELLAVAEAGPPGELEHARTGLVRAQIAFVTYRGGDAPHLLLKAAQRLEPVAPDLARATYLEALAAAAFAGGLAGPGGSVLPERSTLNPCLRPPLPNFSWKAWRRTRIRVIQPGCRRYAGL